MSEATDLIGERRAVVSGAGQSDIGRRLFRDPLELTLDACLAAIEDAGLTTADIDGLSTYPGAFGPGGFSGGGMVDVHDGLRFENIQWFCGGVEFPGQLGAVINAALAVSAGLCKHVLVWRSVWEGSAQGTGGRAAVMPGGGGSGSFKASGFMEWVLPFSAPSAATWIAMFAQRHFHEYGTTREQLGQIAVNSRKNAGLNPKAIYSEPMSMDDYLSARMISTPLCLFDCDVPCDGATAFIVSRADTVADLRKPPINIEAVATALHGRPSWDQYHDLTSMPAQDAGKELWKRTDLKPTDVDVANMYDGFSFITVAWIEGMGFCKKGEAGAFLEGGHNIARDSGVLPLNTNGGQLSAGRLHGFGFLHESCVQLWGEAGERQVPNTPEVGVACAGGGPMAGTLLLTHRR